MHTRTRQPYNKKTISKGGALIFGLGLGALLATIVIVIGIAIPNISRRLENLPYYAQTYYRKLVPHPEYLPTPAPVVSGPAVPAQDSAGPIKLELPPVAGDVSSAEVIPAAVAIDGQATSPSDTTEETGGENPSAADSTSDVVVYPTGTFVQLVGMNHQWQTWNNCGPATITTDMSYFNHTETQVEAAAFLKPNPDDKNVSPHELAAYAQTTGLGAIVRRGGTIDQIKLLLSNNFPVVAETWLIHDGDGLGHYRLITGFDDESGEFITSDSLSGPDYRVNYAQFDSDWRVFNRLYLVVFPPEQAEIVSAIIGKDMDDTVMYERLLTQAQAETAANPNDAIAFFNTGEDLTRLGRYQEAVIAFDRARTLGLHWRRLWYQFTPFEAYYATGRFQDVLDLAAATIKGTGGLEEAYYYQGLALHATGQPGAAEAFQAAIDYNANFTVAYDALASLTTN